MGCQKCWPTLSQAEIDRRELPCRTQCQEEGGCPKCQARKARQEHPLYALRKKILSIYGQASAFGLINDGDLDEAKAVKETGLQIKQEAREALEMLNEIQRKGPK